MSRLTCANVMATAAVCIAAGGGAWAASSTGEAARVLHGCYAKRGGVLRVVGARKHCRRGERAVSWNQQGPQGLPGVPGVPGQNGAAGAPGKDGAPATALWAIVAADGTLIAGSHASSTPIGMGLTYKVTFDRDVSRCATVGTARTGNNGETFVVADPHPGDPASVDVTIGSGQHSITASPFSLAVFCSP